MPQPGTGRCFWWDEEELGVSAVSVPDLCPAGVGPAGNRLDRGPENGDAGGRCGRPGMSGRALRGKQPLPISRDRWEAAGNSRQAARGRSLSPACVPHFGSALGRAQPCPQQCQALGVFLPGFLLLDPPTQPLSWGPVRGDTRGRVPSTRGLLVPAALLASPRQLPRPARRRRDGCRAR